MKVIWDVEKFDVIAVGSDNADYDAEDVGKIAVQYNGEFLEFVGHADALDEALTAARAFIVQRIGSAWIMTSGDSVWLRSSDNYFSCRRWIAVAM